MGAVDQSGVECEEWVRTMAPRLMPVVYAGVFGVMQCDE